MPRLNQPQKLLLFYSCGIVLGMTAPITAALIALLMFALRFKDVIALPDTPVAGGEK